MYIFIQHCEVNLSLSSVETSGRRLRGVDVQLQAFMTLELD